MPNIDEAIEALLSYQQADMEGVMVLTSRQAIHEVADELKRVRSHAQYVGAYPFLMALRHTAKVMKRAHDGGGDRLMSIWTEDLQAVEEAIKALSSDGSGENQPEQRTGPHRVSGETNSGATGDSELARSARPPSDPLTPAEGEKQDDWREDPSSDERWNAGVDFAMKQLCAALGVEPDAVRWDAATETVEGDVQAVQWNIIRAAFGEEFDPDEAKQLRAQVERAKEYADAALGNAAECSRLEVENTLLRNVHKAASVYYGCYVQDEAEEIECCISPEQHEAAKALRDALKDASKLSHSSTERQDG